jgi:hypothetical protein
VLGQDLPVGPQGICDVDIFLFQRAVRRTIAL